MRAQRGDERYEPRGPDAAPDEEGARTPINLRAIFAAVDVPWDDDLSPAAFRRAMTELERRDRGPARGE